MKKCGIFIFVFTFSVIICAYVLKPQYMTFSQKWFGGIVAYFNDLSLGFHGLANGKKLAQENEQLKKELSRIHSKDAENARLLQENENLCRLLNLNRKSPYKKQIAANIVRLNTLGEFSLVIDKGQKYGIDVGTVSVWGDALVGKVTEVYDNFSVVTPITSPDSVTGVMNATENAGTVSGSLSLCNKNMCKLDFFSEAVQKSTGDIIYTSGLSDIYPKGLVLGKIHDAKANPTIKTEVDFFKIRTLSLIIGE